MYSSFPWVETASAVSRKRFMSLALTESQISGKKHGRFLRVPHWQNKISNHLLWLELDQKNCREKRSLDCKAVWKLGREFQVCSFGESSSQCCELVSDVPAFESPLIRALVREPNKCSLVHQIGHWRCRYFFLLCFLLGVNCVALPQETSVTQLLPPK